jgi:hypothetical protein
MQSALTYFVSGSREQDTGSSVHPALNDGNIGLSIYNVQIDDPVIDDRGVVTGGRYSYPFRTRTNPDGTLNYDLSGKGANQFADGGLGMGTSRSFNEHRSATGGRSRTTCSGCIPSSRPMVAKCSWARSCPA